MTEYRRVSNLLDALLKANGIGMLISIPLFFVNGLNGYNYYPHLYFNLISFFLAVTLNVFLNSYKDDFTTYRWEVFNYIKRGAVFTFLISYLFLGMNMLMVVSKYEKTVFEIRYFTAIFYYMWTSITAFYVFMSFFRKN